MAVVRMRKNSLPTARQWLGDGNEDHSRVMLRRYFYQVLSNEDFVLFNFLYHTPAIL